MVATYTFLDVFTYVKMFCLFCIPKWYQYAAKLLLDFVWSCIFKVVKLLFQFKSWLYFSISALYTNYEPYKPSRTTSNRLLNDKTASNALSKKNTPMALRLVMNWLYFSSLALHSKYEPYKPSESPSNRLLKDKTASNALE